jgi:hypothetical protein
MADKEPNEADETRAWTVTKVTRSVRVKSCRRGANFRKVAVQNHRNVGRSSTVELLQSRRAVLFSLCSF